MSFAIKMSIWCGLLIWMPVLLSCQQCLNQNGVPVAWWTILKVPPMIGNSGYAYFDSASAGASFQFHNKTVDLDVSPLSQTLSLINKESLERVAWNDEKPDNHTSSTKAHAKGIIAYGKTSAKGFLIVHSIPKYPAFLEDHSVYLQIPQSEQRFGQHITCFSLSLYELDKIAGHLLISRPNVYESKVSLKSSTLNIYDLSLSKFPLNTDLFHYYDIKPSSNYTVSAIFKNDKINGSIFEDGVAQWLNSGEVVAQTWGRPLQSAWCWRNFQVKNVKRLRVTQGIEWTEGQDHSKWMTVGSKYACFGDMNRMESQWKRGGAFYCIHSMSLNIALKNSIMEADNCNQTGIYQTKDALVSQ